MRKHPYHRTCGLLTALLCCISPFTSVVADPEATTSAGEQTVTVIETPPEILTRQKLPNFVGISAQTAGARGLSMNLVLEGVFSDEHGDYPAGTFLMNPHGSRHSPRSEPGCTLFVRLRQYPGSNRPRLVEYTRAESRWHPGLVDGLRVRPLYAQGGYPENVALVRWAPGTHFQRHTHWGGEEILVLEGEFGDEHGRYPEGTWIRSPHGSQHTPFSAKGCLIYVRVGGL